MGQLPERHRLATDLEDLTEQARIGRGPSGERCHLVHRDERQPAFPTAEDERSAGSAGRVPEDLLPGLDERPGPDDAPRDVAGPECLLGCELGTKQVGRRVGGRPEDRHQDHRRPGRSRCREEVRVACLVDLGRPLPATAEEPVERGDHGRSRPHGVSQAVGTAYVDLHDLRPCRPGPVRRARRSRVSTRTGSPWSSSARDHPPAEQPAAAGHDDHGGSPLTWRPHGLVDRDARRRRPARGRTVPTRRAHPSARRP